MKANEGSRLTPQVKICGLTRADEAAAAAELGAAAIGLVFYPPSPRYVTVEQAAGICAGLPEHVCPVGVFVDVAFDEIMRKVRSCNLKGVQLHGREPPELGKRLLGEGLVVIRGLYVNKDPSIQRAHLYPASAYLLEYGGGPLPGGNALAWDWSAAAGVGRDKPLVLAGGLNPDNVAQAIQVASPDAVDVSSGVESAPGKKDIAQMRRFLDAVREAVLPGPRKQVF